MEQVSAMGIDLAKNIFELHGRDIHGRVVFQKRVRRAELREVVAKVKPQMIVVEACGGSNYWAREFQKLGCEVRLISPQFVKPYVKTNKNDRADAEAICEAATRPGMHFVPIKSVEQQDIQNLHRVRQRLVQSRTALSNQIRGLLAEYGVVIPQGSERFSQRLSELLQGESAEMSFRCRKIIEKLSEELRAVKNRIVEMEFELNDIFKTSETCRRLERVPGVGTLTATAILAAVGDPKVFRNGRQLSAWLGLVPRQHSSGGKDRLLGISKRGDKYLRTLLVHGARAVLRHHKTRRDHLGEWLGRLETRRGIHKACVALANKNARVLWALMATGKEYRLKAA
ncbi:MAG TPA: IS110 family transposase [Bdellovibrionota bacterium]|nr:IS110 family transposase [Bdellovibrionota bacterium]